MGHMANISEPVSPAFIGAAPVSGDLLVRIRRGEEYIAIPLFALVVSSVLFSLFLLALGKSPVQFFDLVYLGGFGNAFSIQNTLQRSAPLILTALAVAVPARIGLIMIGGEGALVLGGFVSAVVAIPLVPGHVAPPVSLTIIALVGTPMGAFWVGPAGYPPHPPAVHQTMSATL